MSLNDVLGQKGAVLLLKSLLRERRLSGSYLFAGPEGVGKSLSARRFTKALLCETKPGEGCAVCPSCRQVEAGSHPDLLWCEVTEGTTHSIDAIRELKRQVSLKSWGGSYRLVVIIEVERATEEAQNALLRLLEEPPSQTLFILTSVQTERVLPTVRSRCKTVLFQSISEEVVAHVAQESWKCPSQEAALLARLSRGSLGLAHRLKESGFLEKKNRWIDEFLPKALQIDRSADFFGDRKESQELLEVLLGWIRDQWIASLHGNQKLFLNQDREKDLLRNKRSSHAQLEAALQEILLAEERLGQNANQKLTLFVLATRLKDLGLDG